MNNPDRRAKHRLKALVVLLLLCQPGAVQAQIFPELSLDHVVDAGGSPVAIRNAGDGSGRLFIVRKAGDIVIYDSATDSILPTPFLDITSLVDSSGWEQGLLGLAFHPDYAANGYFYVNYIHDPGPGLDRTVIARYSVSAGDPNVADPASGAVLMEVEQPYNNHNGGDLHFGPDGYLYIGMGDGGSGGDPLNNAQDLGTLLGKVLRIDVDASTPASPNDLCGLNASGYGIPTDNPYAGGSGDCDEIWAYGVRNPWRFSFDDDTGDMFIGDVGQDGWEEIDFQPAGTSGIDYGWRCREGAHDYNTSPPCPGPLTDPILEYPHTSGCCSVTGGYRYRGKYLPLNGIYIYGDYLSGRIWFANKLGGGWTSTEWIDTAHNITSFGVDEEQEVYLASLGGGIYRITTPACPSRICPEGMSAGWKAVIPQIIGP